MNGITEWLWRDHSCIHGLGKGKETQTAKEVGLKRGLFYIPDNLSSFQIMGTIN